jgi:hypothetical protein
MHLREEKDACVIIVNPLCIKKSRSVCIDAVPISAWKTRNGRKKQQTKNQAAIWRYVGRKETGISLDVKVSQPIDDLLKHQQQPVRIPASAYHHSLHQQCFFAKSGVVPTGRV